jgi:hypothetical protein
MFYEVWKLKAQRHFTGKTLISKTFAGYACTFFIVMNIFLLHVMSGQIHK